MHYINKTIKRVVQTTSRGVGSSSADFPSSFGGGVEAHGHLSLEARGGEMHSSIGTFTMTDRGGTAICWMVSGSGCRKVSGRKTQNTTLSNDREPTRIHGRN
ncbi:hypothetical protein EYF80_016218 [Liparis tanakae]|uniref:Uncharacterized protein n=1 Tax=Liparis tanakae TaxID=230148 RepID=A0A4Z2I935_9TELE|nr:hypothetical protein EYF80_016218 [Liparis tanakae]